MAKEHDRDRARAGRDVAGVGPDPREVRHLLPLSELQNVRVSSGEPDIRGWRVFSSGGRALGTVDDLLVDTTRGEVAMLDIGLGESDRHSLAPIRAAWVDREHKRVILDSATFDAEEEIPSLSRGRVSDEEARRFGERYDRAYGERGTDPEGDSYVLRAGEAIRFGRTGARREAGTGSEERQGGASAARLSDWRVVERPSREPAHRASSGDDEPEARSEPREVRYPAREGGAPRIVEEVVVRRRILGEGEGEGEESPPPPS